VTTQISELGPTQRRRRATAPASDGTAVTTVEPAPGIAFTQQEACASLGCTEEFSWSRSVHIFGLRSDGKRASVKQGSIAGSPTSPANLVRMRLALAQSVDPASGLHLR
jgi:hypothetical protein